MRNTKLILLCFSILIFIGSFAQETNNKWGYYLQIIDSNYIPQITNNETTGYITLFTGISDYDNVFAKYKTTEFYQSFPTASTDWLRQVYVLICDSGQVELGKELKEKYSSVIPLIENYYHNPTLTGTNEIRMINSNLCVSQKGNTLLMEGFNGLSKKIYIYDLKGLLIYSINTKEDRVNISNNIPKGVFVYKVILESEIKNGRYYNR